MSLLLSAAQLRRRIVLPATVSSGRFSKNGIFYQEDISIPSFIGGIPSLSIVGDAAYGPNYILIPNGGNQCLKADPALRNFLGFSPFTGGSYQYPTSFAYGKGVWAALYYKPNSSGWGLALSFDTVNWVSVVQGSNNDYGLSIKYIPSLDRFAILTADDGGPGYMTLYVLRLNDPVDLSNITLFGHTLLKSGSEIPWGSLVSKAVLGKTKLRFTRAGQYVTSILYSEMVDTNNPISISEHSMTNPVDLTYIKETEQFAILSKVSNNALRISLMGDASSSAGTAYVAAGGTINNDLGQLVYNYGHLHILSVDTTSLGGSNWWGRLWRCHRDSIPMGDWNIVTETEGSPSHPWRAVLPGQNPDVF